MANTQVFAPEILDDNSDNSFEKEMKTCLKWSKEEWNLSGKQGTKWSRFVGFVKYWNYRLKEAYNSTTLILTVYNSEKDAYLDIEKILSAIQLLTPLDNIIGFFRLRNPRLLGLEFSNEKVKTFIEANLLMIENDNVCFINWALDDGNINLSIHWMPRSVKKERIIEILEKYMIIKEMDFEKNDFSMKKKFCSGKYIIKAQLHKEIKSEDVPHLFYIGQLQGLITIKGRSPLCLCCESVGHIASDCPTPYCPTCKEKRPTKHSCSKVLADKISYANKAKPQDYSFLNEEGISIKGSTLKQNTVSQNKISEKEYPPIKKNSKIEITDVSNLPPLNNKEKTLITNPDIKESNLVQNSLQAPYVIKTETKDISQLETTKPNDQTMEVNIEHETSESDKDSSEAEYIEAKNKKIKRRKEDLVSKNSQPNPNIQKITRVYGRTKKASSSLFSENLFDSLGETDMDTSQTFE